MRRPPTSMGPPTSMAAAPEAVALDALALALIPRLLPLVVAQLGAPVADQYTSTSPPPRTTRRRFREVCASGIVEGARKEGMSWACSRTAWHQARSRRSEPRPPVVAAIDASMTAQVDRLLARAGLRIVGGTR